MGNGLIARLGVAGYEKIEPAIITCWALGWPIVLAGPPGTAKTYVADLLSMAENGRTYWRRFDCPKENIVTIAGLPDMKAIERGQFKFVSEVPDGQNSSFVWGKKNLVFNEFTRMSAESQNFLLEVLQERTFFGQDLPTRRVRDPNQVHYSIIATENPLGIGVKRIDDALRDRFYMAVNVPDGQAAVDEAQRRGIVGANLYLYERDDEGKDPVLANCAAALRREYGQLVADAPLIESVVRYGIFLWNSFFDVERGVYVSNRRQAMLTEMILGLLAYQRMAGAHPDPKEAASLALNYGVILPLKLTHEQAQQLLRCHEKAAIYLAEQELDPSEKLSAELLMRPLLRDKLAYLSQEREAFLTLLKTDAREKLLGELAKEAKGADLLDLHRFLKTLGGHEELFRKQELRVVAALSQAVQKLIESTSRLHVFSFDDLASYELLEHFLKLIARGPLPPQAVRLLLAPAQSDVEAQLSSLVAVLETASVPAHVAAGSPEPVAA